MYLKKRNDMQDKKISQEEFRKNMTSHLSRLEIIQDSFSIFCDCLEQEICNNPSKEMGNLGAILKDYIEKTKKDFSNFAQKFNALN